MRLFCPRLNQRLARLSPSQVVGGGLSLELLVFGERVYLHTLSNISKMSLGLSIRGSQAAYRIRRLCPNCHHTLLTPSQFRYPPPIQFQRHHLSTGPLSQQVQQYLEQARRSIQAAIRVLRDHSAKLSMSLGGKVDQLGSRLNHVTGYEDIDRLKASVVEIGKPTKSDNADDRTTTN